MWYPDKEYDELVASARKCGFRVGRGRNSQLRLFVMTATGEYRAKSSALRGRLDRLEKFKTLVKAVITGYEMFGEVSKYDMDRLAAVLRGDE